MLFEQPLFHLEHTSVTCGASPDTLCNDCCAHRLVLFAKHVHKPIWFENGDDT